MKKLFYLSIALMCFSSCGVNEQDEGLFADPVPCHVEAIYANIGRIGVDEVYGTPDISNIDGGVEAEYFHISVLTFDSIIGWNGESLEFQTGIGQGRIASEGMYCEESIPEVEQHIYNWAGNVNNENRSSWESSTRTMCYHFPYRLEGVTVFTITANKPFNGVEADKDITECFIIEQFSPELVFNYEDYSVCFDNAQSITVSQWLSMKPLASPCLLLRLTDKAQETASDIAFTITMTLTDGKVLTSTTPMTNLL